MALMVARWLNGLPPFGWSSCLQELTACPVKREPVMIEQVFVFSQSLREADVCSRAAHAVASTTRDQVEAVTYRYTKSHHLQVTWWWVKRRCVKHFLLKRLLFSREWVHAVRISLHFYSTVYRRKSSFVIELVNQIVNLKKGRGCSHKPLVNSASLAETIKKGNSTENMIPLTK